MEGEKSIWGDDGEIEGEGEIAISVVVIGAKWVYHERRVCKADLPVVTIAAEDTQKAQYIIRHLISRVKQYIILHRTANTKHNRRVTWFHQRLQKNILYHHRGEQGLQISSWIADGIEYCEVLVRGKSQV